jgi:hypothetical protein
VVMAYVEPKSRRTLWGELALNKKFHLTSEKNPH